ncbi:MAG: transcription antitermination factor NusB [Bradymonadales bacterium]|nr:MAG: transcription antitermination factor NusB [Bradymonadales bacterium]
MGTRRQSREAALSFLYQRDSVDQSQTNEADRFFSHFFSDYSEAYAYYKWLTQTLEIHGAEVDALISRSTENWKISRMAKTDRAVLRVATCELLKASITPSAVILDEAVELAKKFGGEDSGSFVNGVLDKISKLARPEADSFASEKAL